MNKKQLIVMWVAIAVFVLLAFDTRIRFGRTYTDAYTCYGPYVIHILSASIITAALIYTLKDKKRDGANEKKMINCNQGFKRLTVFLSIIAAVIAAAMVVFVFSDILLTGDFMKLPVQFVRKFGIIESFKQAEMLLVLHPLACLIFYPLVAFDVVWLLYYLLRWFAISAACGKKACEK
jgi:hypothetical protein